MIARTYTTTIVRDDPMCIIPVPFDPKPVFGAVRAPVRVTLNGYTFRSTISNMGGPFCIPFRRSHGGSTTRRFGRRGIASCGSRTAGSRWPGCSS